jgi:hypothetical protein
MYIIFHGYLIFDFFQEITFYSNSMNTLKMAQQKFTESQECLGKLDAKSKDKEILVPLTSSVSFQKQQGYWCAITLPQ